MKVIIAGGRDFKPNAKHVEWIDGLFIGLPITEVVSGGAAGADAFGETLAMNRSIPVKTFKPDWTKYGKAAGPIRNRQMAEYAEACITFPGGSGTSDMEDAAKAIGIKLYRYADL